MRFQQKQQVEREQKKLDMLGTTTRNLGKMSLNPDETKLLTSSLGAGKVRQMFEERRDRERIGIDKAYPLKPISSNTTEHITPRTTEPRKRNNVVARAVNNDISSRTLDRDPLNNTIVVPKYNSTNRVPSLKSNNVNNNNLVTNQNAKPLVKPLSTGKSPSAASTVIMSTSAEARNVRKVQHNNLLWYTHIKTTFNFSHYPLRHRR